MASSEGEIDGNSPQSADFAEDRIAGSVELPLCRRSQGNLQGNDFLQEKRGSGKHNMEGRALSGHAFDFYAPSIVVADALYDGKPYAQTFTLG